MGYEVVEEEHISGGEKGFIRVHNLRRIEHPPGEEVGKELGEPQRQTRNTDHRDTPEFYQVFQFFPVSPAIKLRHLPKIQEVTYMIEEVANVSPPWQHGTGAAQQIGALHQGLVRQISDVEDRIP